MKKVVGIIICMLFIGSVLSVSGSELIEKICEPTLNGNTLYVGGSGPGNYSTIQEAVDDAEDGDIVFVFSESSPYNESVTVAKPITIRGENKLTTIIDRSHEKGDAFFLYSNNVTITGFTIQNTGTGIYIAGPGYDASYNIITDNIILNTACGIQIFYGSPSKPGFSNLGYNTISNNTIINTTFCGIRSVRGRNTNIIGNSISENHGYSKRGYGIEVSGAFNNISLNNVFDNDFDGIIVGESYKTTIYRNNIENNGRYGLTLFDTSFDKVIQNNFIDNHRNAFFGQAILFIIETHRGNYPILPNSWDSNYWGKPRSIPYIIPGLVGLHLFLPSIIYDSLGILPFNFFRLDIHPAQEPYDIVG